ncbi:MAG: DNA-binding protein [Bacteroidaceae bacterium]|nr:DNA-binding protein [Bacteroidaceae bacterium]
MKLKYFIPFIVAIVAMFAISCSEDNEPTYLDGLRVSDSYVSISEEGDTVEIQISADEDWHITCCDTCEIFNHDHMQKGKPSGYLEWLDIDKISGQAGTHIVKFSAAKYTGGRSAEVFLVCGDKVQHINIIQGLSTIIPATCKEVLDGPDSKTYRVTGTCTSIANTTYGNWYINDGTGEVYIYGTLDEKGQTKNFLSLGIEVGDIITVEGPKTTYNGTVELVDVTVVNIQKSLIKVDSVKVGDVVTDTIPATGGYASAYLSCKGSGVSVEIPNEAREWLSIISITAGSNPVVLFKATENIGGDRSTTVVFKTSQSGVDYTSEMTINQVGQIVECSISDFIAAPVGETQYRITGIITNVAKADYGNVYIRDYSGEVYVYGIGAKGDFAKLGLKEGDIVTLVGKRGVYNDTPQMTGGKYETHKSVVPVSIAQFLTMPDGADTYYMVSGNIVSIEKPDYGNCYITDGTNNLCVYGCYPGWGAKGDYRKGLFAEKEIKIGDNLTVIGPKTTYGTTIEVNGGIYFSHTPANFTTK